MSDLERAEAAMMNSKVVLTGQARKTRILLISREVPMHVHDQMHCPSARLSHSTSQVSFSQLVRKKVSCLGHWSLRAKENETVIKRTMRGDIPLTA